MSVLESSLTVAEGCKSHNQNLAGYSLGISSEQVSAGFEIYTGQIKVHRRRVAVMLEYSSGTASLVCEHS